MNKNQQVRGILETKITFPLGKKQNENRNLEASGP